MEINNFVLNFYIIFKKKHIIYFYFLSKTYFVYYEILFIYVSNISYQFQVILFYFCSNVRFFKSRVHTRLRTPELMIGVNLFSHHKSCRFSFISSKTSFTNPKTTCQSYVLAFPYLLFNSFVSLSLHYLILPENILSLSLL